MEGLGESYYRDNSALLADLAEIEKTLNSLDPEAKGPGLMTYREAENRFVPRTYLGKGFPLYQSMASTLIYRDKEATFTHLVEGFEKLEQKTCQLMMEIARLSNSSCSKEELEILDDRLNRIVHVIDSKANRCVSELIDTYTKREKEIGRVQEINKKSQNIFDLLKTGKKHLEDELLSSTVESGSLPEPVDIEEEEEEEGFDDFVLVDPSELEIIKNEAQNTAERVVGRAQEYKGHLISIAVDMEKGVVIPLGVVQDCVDDLALQKGLKKDILAETNNIYEPFKMALPLPAQEDKLVWTSLAIAPNPDAPGMRIEKDASIPTSQRDELHKDQNDLANFKYQVNANGHVCITCGGIDTQRKADEFAEGLIYILKQRGPDNPPHPLRIVLHQVNSFENDAGLLTKQHQLSRYIEQRLQEFLIPENAKACSLVHPGDSPLIAHVNLAFNFSSTLPWEDKKSNQQNLDGLAAQAVWLIDDLLQLKGDGEIKDLPGCERLIERREEILTLRSAILWAKEEIYLTETMIKSGEIEGAKAKEAGSEIKIRKKEIASHQEKLAKQLKAFAEEAHLLQKDLEQAPMNERELLLKMKLRILSLILAKQTYGLPLVDAKGFSRVTELELHLLFDFYTNLVSQVNCKSGLDRTGFARSLWDALHSMHDLFSEEYKKTFSQEQSQILAYENLINFVLKQDALMAELDAIQYEVAQRKDIAPYIATNLNNIDAVGACEKNLRGEILQAIEEKYPESPEKQKELKDLLKYQDLVAKNLLAVAQVVTIESTGTAGLKYGQDAGRLRSLASNPHPLKRLPMFVSMEDGKIVQMYQTYFYSALFPSESLLFDIGEGKHYLTAAGIGLLLRNSIKRGA